MHSLFYGGGVLFLVVKRKTLLFFALAVTFALAAVVSLRAIPALPAFSTVNRGSPTVYVLDAGHGGEDGGAVSASGILESHVNLAITLDLNEILQFLGRKTVMTRTEDISIHSPDAETLRQKKASDLKNRVALVNATPGAVLVSVHQNSLPSVPSVHGAQVFYGTIESSETLAASVQSALNQSVNDGNEKHEKKIDPSIYLMKNVNCPAILVECGFLSNAAEAERLLEPYYRTTLAVTIAAGVLNAGTEGETP